MWCITVNGFELRFAYPLLLLLAVPVIAVVCCATEFMNRRRHKKREQRLALLLRILTIFVAALLASGMTVVTDRLGTTVLIAADTSDSVKDYAGQIAADTKSLVGMIRRENVKVVSFAEKTIPERVNEKNGEAFQLTTQENGGVTDIARILNESLSLLPPNMHGRIILLTDGLETGGDAVAAARTLANKGIRVDTVLYTTEQVIPEAEIKSIVLPAEASLGTTYDVIVTVQSSTVMGGKLALYDNDEFVREVMVSLKNGTTEFEYRINAITEGVHVISAVLMPDEDHVA